MSDLLFQNFSTVQSAQQASQPNTITAASTVAPTNFVTFIAGTTALTTITPPVTGAHMLCIIATTTNWSGATTSGNILVASVTNSVLWANRANLFVYVPATAKYYPAYATAT